MTLQRSLSLADLRRHAVARTLFAPTNLSAALKRLGYVQADPLRHPARAQDLILRHRVKGYRMGDLDTRYTKLDIVEDWFVNHGYVSHATQALMHPRTPRTVWSKAKWKQAQAVLSFIRERGTVHPREVNAQFSHGKVRNWFGGTSNASTQLLDGMHYRGLIRIAGRASGVRLYACRDAADKVVDPSANMDALVDVIVKLYAPLPDRTLGELVSRLRGGAPQWADLRREALKRAKARLPHATVDGVAWYWPAGENPGAAKHRVDDAVRLLAPFDPIVWDRRRFEHLWGWTYRFEAYTPAPKRVRGYYAMPLLWHDQVIGWGNMAVRDGALHTDIGYVSGKAPRSIAFRQALEAEVACMGDFLDLGA